MPFLLFQGLFACRDESPRLRWITTRFETGKCFSETTQIHITDSHTEKQLSASGKMIDSFPENGDRIFIISPFLVENSQAQVRTVVGMISERLQVQPLR